MYSAKSQHFINPIEYQSFSICCHWRQTWNYQLLRGSTTFAASHKGTKISFWKISPQPKVFENTGWSSGNWWHIYIIAVLVFPSLSSILLKDCISQKAELRVPRHYHSFRLSPVTKSALWKTGELLQQCKEYLMGVLCGIRMQNVPIRDTVPS